MELGSWYCPLTDLENHLLQASGAAGYAGSFIGAHLLPLLYPSTLTRPMQLMLGGLVVAINMLAYALVWR